MQVPRTNPRLTTGTGRMGETGMHKHASGNELPAHARSLDVEIERHGPICLEVTDGKWMQTSLERDLAASLGSRRRLAERCQHGFATDPETRSVVRHRRERVDTRPRNSDKSRELDSEHLVRVAGRERDRGSGSDPGR